MLLALLCVSVLVVLLMAGLWVNNPETKEGKYLVKRRDGTVPEWPWFVLGARDPSSPAGLRGYAQDAARRGRDPEYVRDILALAERYEAYLREHGEGDPDAPRHRKDDPVTVAEMSRGRGA